MFSPYFMLPTLVVSVAIDYPHGAPQSLYQTARSRVALLQSLNASTLSYLNAPNLMTQEVLCKGPRELEPPQIESCRDAAAQMPLDPSMILQPPTYTYGPRDVPGMNTDWKLPIRYISCLYHCRPGQLPRKS